MLGCFGNQSEVLIFRGLWQYLGCEFLNFIDELRDLQVLVHEFMLLLVQLVINRVIVQFNPLKLGG